MSAREQSPAEVETFSIKGLVIWTTYALGLLGVLLGHFAFGFGWVTSILLFFPVYSLACGIVSNESQLYTYGLADEVLAASSPTTSAETVRRIREWERVSG